MKIAVVILNWNGQALLEQFLPSVVEYSAEADIYVADNASTDNSIAFLKQHYPTVKLIKNSKNQGYAKGYNEALKALNADVFCLLNNDVAVTPNWLAPIIQEFSQHPNTAIVQPKLLSYKTPNKFDYAGAAGGFIDKFGYPFCRGRLFNAIETDQQQYTDRADILWASGACLFIKNEVFKNLNGFDDSFFAHMEEIDLCWRAFNRNLPCIYIGNSTVYHVGGATLHNSSAHKTFLNFRNSLLTLVKNAHGNIWFLIFVRLCLDGVAGIKFLFNLKPQHTLAIIKSHFSFYKRLPAALTFRKHQKKKANYYKHASIVWLHYLKRVKTYTSL